MLSNQAEPEPPTHEQIGMTLITQLHGCHETYGEYRGVRIPRKHIAWYCKGIRNATRFRELINHVEQPAEQIREVERFFACPEIFEAAA